MYNVIFSILFPSFIQNDENNILSRMVNTMISVHVKRTKGNVEERLVKIRFKINQVT